MTRMSVFALALAAGAAMSAPALADPPCLQPRLVEGWTTAGENAIVVRTIRGERFRVELSGRCPGLEHLLALRVGTRSSGTCVTRGDLVSYRYHEFGEETCMIDAITPVADESQTSSQAHQEQQDQRNQQHTPAPDRNVPAPQQPQPQEQPLTQH